MARTFSSGYLTLNTSFEVPKPFSFAAWVFPNANASNNERTIISSAGGGDGGVQFRTSSSGQLQLIKTDIVAIGDSGANAINNGTWAHVGVSYSSGGVYTFYINGNAAGTGTNDQTITATANYAVGWHSLGAVKEYWADRLAELGVWNAALDATEFAALAEAYSPLLIRPDNLIDYIPMVRELVSAKWSAHTQTNTTISVHPRMFYRKRKRV